MNVHRTVRTIFPPLPRRSDPVVHGEVVCHRAMTGRGLSFPRDLFVWLPPSYRTHRSRRYPVLYMHDGRNLFDPSTSTSGYDWRLDETASALITGGLMKEIIIVGIAQTPDRQSEYSDSPLGKAYMRFVVDTVKPFIDAGYRTKKGRKETAVMGSSMGAFISLMLAWKYPSVFGQVGCLSASLWVADGKIVREIGADDTALRTTRIYIDCGENEKDLLPGYHAMTKMFRRKAKVRGKDYERRIEPGARHHERYWSRRVWRSLMFLFGK